MEQKKKSPEFLDGYYEGICIMQRIIDKGCKAAGVESLPPEGLDAIARAHGYVNVNGDIDQIDDRDKEAAKTALCHTEKYGVIYEGTAFALDAYTYENMIEMFLKGIAYHKNSIWHHRDVPMGTEENIIVTGVELPGLMYGVSVSGDTVRTADGEYTLKKHDMWAYQNGLVPSYEKLHENV